MTDFPSSAKHSRMRACRNVSRRKIGLSIPYLCFFTGAVCAAQTTAPLTVARWMGDRSAAISLTFDDAMATQLDNAGPVLKKHGIHGTFFVSTGMDDWQNRIQQWQHLAADGNEIGGHSVTHPCLMERIEPHAQVYNPQMMEAEMRDSAQTILREIRGQHGLTYAYTCGNTSFGPPADQARNSALYQKYIAEHFYAARSYGWSGTVAPDELGVLAIPDLGAAAGQDFRALLAMAEPAFRNHRWGVYTFHGVGGQWLSVTTEALDELAAYLARHREVWTATFGDVVRYILESQALGIRPSESSDKQVQFELNWPLDAQIYNLPLTLKWTLPDGWTLCRAFADGKPLPLTATQPNSKVMLLDVPPQTKSLRFENR